MPVHRAAGWVKALAGAVALAATVVLARGRCPQQTQPEPERRMDSQPPESEQRFRAIAEAMPAPILVASRQGQALLYVNAALAAALGADAAALLHTPAPLLFAGEQEWRKVQEHLDGGAARESFEACLRPSSGPRLWAVVSVQPLVYAGQDACLVAFQDITERWRLEDQLRVFSQQLIQVQEEERRRVARELHDGVNQILSAIRFRTEVLLQQATDASLTEGTRRVVELVDSAINEVRRISHGLRPTVLDDLGLAAAARTLLDEFAARTGLRIEADIAPLPSPLPGSVETTVYRILQEALQNVARHAQASTVRVELGCRRGSVCAVISDDGRGMEYPPRARSGNGMGLASMRERAKLAGGSLRITSRPSSGTELRLTIPVAGPASGIPDRT